MLAINKIELVYFDIHARGELTRLCFAAANRLSDLVDTRLGLFMESDKYAQEWQYKYRPKTPFGYLPYLNVTQSTLNDAQSYTTKISGDGVVEMFVARHLDLLGDKNNAIDSAICNTISLEAVGLLGPQLTKAGLTGQGDWIETQVKVDGYIGRVFADLEKYLGSLPEHARSYSSKVEGKAGEKEKSNFYVVAGRLSLADLAIFNAVDECIKGPRSQKHFAGVERILRTEYSILMRVYDQISADLSVYIIERQKKFEKN